MTPARVLVAGIGNIFLGDDAFGVEVARRLIHAGPPDGVRVVDFGIRGLDLVYSLLDGYEAVILVDAAPRGGRPGTLYVLDIETDGAQEAEPLVEAHALDPVKVLELAAALGGRVGRLLLVGCEPTPSDHEADLCDGLTAPVLAAVDEAVALIPGLAARLLRGERIEAVGDHTVPE